MFDIHCHMLPGVDDGPSDIGEAVEIAYAAQKAGMEAIVCTPHYIDDYFKSSPEDNHIVLDNLKKALEVNGIGIKLYIGNEILITPDIIKLLDMDRVSTLNNSRYVLIEMPIHSKPVYTDDVIFKLKLRGLVPVIAHPERYEWVNKNPFELSSIIQNGCLTQLNIASISGLYGKSVRKTAEMLVRENRINLLGSDCHSSRVIYDNYKAALKLLKRITSEYTVEQIIQNSEAVIDNQAIKPILMS